jgi:hypothetical protein
VVENVLKTIEKVFKLIFLFCVLLKKLFAKRKRNICI